MIDKAQSSAATEPECRCKEAGQPVQYDLGVEHRADCAWFVWMRLTGGCMGDE